MLFIPLPPSQGGAFSQRTRLGERDYIIRYRHNSRVDSWTIDLEALQEGGDPLPVMTGKKLFIGHDLLRGVTSSEKPNGVLLLLRMNGVNENPGARDLGYCRLAFMEPQ